ncbi:unnamed protein product [Meloidogyne enterolobii]|uniref:Uncharacterized protein n=1 Tax=Meloidogyne enterolobii TaxID=390850 RepID=A0ACB1B2Q8_MELEN
MLGLDLVILTRGGSELEKSGLVVPVTRSILSSDIDTISRFQGRSQWVDFKGQNFFPFLLPQEKILRIWTVIGEKLHFFDPLLKFFPFPHFGVGLASEEPPSCALV